MSNLSDNRKALEDFNNKNILALKNIWQIPVAREARRRVYFAYLVFIESVSNYGFSSSTRPITVLERMAICKSQLEAIIENPGNTREGSRIFVPLFGEQHGLIFQRVAGDQD